MKPTSKKQKLIGIQEYLNPNTGEFVPMQVVSVEDRDFNFHKVWLQHLVNSLDSISNQKLRLAFWIIENLNKDNQLVMTQRQIAEKSGMSLKTVQRTMKALQEGEPAFLVRINGGAYMVNPNIIWKGSHKSRMGVVFDYADTARGNEVVSDEETVDAAENALDEIDESEVQDNEQSATVEDSRSTADKLGGVSSKQGRTAC